MTDLIICEKPNVSKKIAEAIGKPKKKSKNSVPYYELKRDGKTVYVASAVGHLFTLVESKKNKFGTYPIFDIKWVPAYTIKGKEYVKNYINLLKELGKKSNNFYIASDWDIEGELIGYHALYYCCGKDNAYRMRFSSLTKKDILNAYLNPDKIDFGLVNAGETRHKLDWYYGINMSVALMQCIKSVNRWQTMSTGRVQGPALAFLVDRELEIKNFIPTPYWVIDANLENNLMAIHEKEKFWNNEEALNIYNKIKDEKTAKVVEVKKNKRKIKPNPPFDLGTLQREAHRIFRFSPKKTQQIAQKLYEKAICSYPRTSSQKLPKDENYIKDILSKISNNKIYGKYAKLILNENRKPIEGKKDDPAHPAIHFVDVPTEILPDDEKKLYDLIVRRTLATFLDDAEREYCNIKLDINGEIFKLSGSRTIKEGWHEVYYFTQFDEKELPIVKKNSLININKINMWDKETKPPKRYTMSSIIKELEKRELGTKATRADIVEKLVKRGYLIDDGSLIVTDLGIGVINVLKKYCPEIIDEKMTRELEKKLDRLQRKTIKPDTVLNEAKKKLTEILLKVKEKQKEIGSELVKNIDTTNKSLKTIGKCNCGGDLVIIKMKNKSRFVGCTNYPECNVIYPLPSKGRIKINNEICETCGKPILTIDNQKICINPECPSKLSEEDKKHLEEIKEKDEEKICPKCGGKLVIKKGVYGTFYGCSNYPKCRYTEKLSGNNEKLELEVVGICPKCEGDLVIKKGRFGEFIACSNYPKCRHTEKIKKDKINNENNNTNNTNNNEDNKNNKDNKKVVGICPNCKGDLVIKKGRYGEFIACSNYPKCKYTEKIKKE